MQIFLALYNFDPMNMYSFSSKESRKDILLFWLMSWELYEATDPKDLPFVGPSNCSGDRVMAG